MKKFLCLFICLIMLFSLIGCSETTISVNVENDEQLNNITLGKNSLLEIGNGLWYDSTTRIVYWWNGYFYQTRYDTVPSPYYAPNGLPYRYNPETNTFEEIKLNKESRFTNEN